MTYVVRARALRKVFLSIKGIYYQAEIMGQTVTWVVPYKFSTEVPRDVDFRVMGTFLQFYLSMLTFANWKLFHSINLVYPPKVRSV
jgi:pescadillo protein